MTDIQLAEPDADRRERRRNDAEQAEFRRRVAMFSLLLLAALTVALLVREDDVGENTADILEWIVIGGVANITTAIGAKAWELVNTIRSRRAQA